MNTPNPKLITSASLDDSWYNRDAVDAMVAAASRGATLIRPADTLADALAASAENPNYIYYVNG